MRGIIDKYLPDLHIPEHRRRTVRIKFAELKIAGILMIKNIKSADRDHRIVLRRNEYQLLQLLRE